MKRIFAAALGAALLSTGAARAGSAVECAIQHLSATGFSEWVGSSHLIEALREQNRRNAGLTQDRIDELDGKWRAEAKSSVRPTIDPVLGRELSQRLRIWRQLSDGVVTEIIVMDDKGMNVAVSDVTSDYWQGDEPKWTETFAKGSLAPHVGEVERDASTGEIQTQVSVAIPDPDSGEIIGAATFGVKVDC